MCSHQANINNKTLSIPKIYKLSYFQSKTNLRRLNKMNLNHRVKLSLIKNQTNNNNSKYVKRIQLNTTTLWKISDKELKIL